MAIDCQHSWYRRLPASNALSPEPLSVVTPRAFESVPVESASEPAGAEPLLDQEPPENGTSPSQMLVEENISNEVAQSSPPSEESSGAVSDCPVSESPVEAESEQPCSDVRVLDLQGDLIPEEPAVAKKSADVVSSPPEPSLPDSVLVTSALEDPPSSAPASEDFVLSVSDSALAQVSIPPPLSAAALDLAPPDDSGDDDDIGDSVPLRDGQELATAWKRISRKKERKKNLARKASSAASDLFVLVRKATRPSLPGARPRKGMDSS